MAERAAEVGQALIDHLQRILASNQSKQQQQGGREGGAVLQQLQQQAEDVEGLTLEAVLGNVWVFRCLNDAELLQTLQHLPAFLEREPEVDEGGREGGRDGGLRNLAMLTLSLPPSLPSSGGRNCDR